MTAPSLQPRLVSVLEERQRWIRAGQGNLPLYLTLLLDCGRHRAGEIVQMLFESQDVFAIEHEQGRIRTIGLAAWRNDGVDLVIEIEDMPDEALHFDEIEAAEIIADLQDKLGTALIATSDIDAEVALALAADVEAANVTLRERLAAAEATIAELEARTVTNDEIEAAHRREAGALSAAEKIRGEFQELSQLHKTLVRETGPLRNLTWLADRPDLIAAVERLRDDAVMRWAVTDSAVLQVIDVMAIRGGDLVVFDGRRKQTIHVDPLPVNYHY